MLKTLLLSHGNSSNVLIFFNILILKEAEGCDIVANILALLSEHMKFTENAGMILIDSI